MPDLISLASGYGNFPAPPVAAAAAVRAIQAGLEPGGNTAGQLPLREALARRYLRPGLPRLSPDQVVITPGTKAALFALLSCVLRPGDEVLLPTPNWFGFDELIVRAGGTVRHLPLAAADNYLLPPEAVRTALTPRTRMLLLSNPNNPTGRVYSRPELAAVLAVARQFPDLYVLSDEIYHLITFGAEPVPSLLDFEDPHGRHLVVNGFSKSLGLLGWSVGYLVAPPALAQACTAWQFATGAAVAMPSQQAALAATLAAPDIAAGFVRQLEPARRQLLTYLTDLPLVPPLQPEATYYAFPDLRAYTDASLPAVAASAALVARFRVAGVEVVDGATCGAPGFVRLSYAVPTAALREALARLNKVLRK